MSQPPPTPHVPFAQPIPVADVVASQPTFEEAIQRRPGLVTTLGISSLVMSVMQVGVAMITFFMAIGIWVMSNLPASQPYQPTVANTTWPDGLADPQKSQLTNRMTELAHLSSARHDALEALFTKSGRDVAPTMLHGVVDAASVKKLVSSFGRTAEGNDFLLVPTGRIELSDTTATFEPDGSTGITVVSAAEMAPNAIVPGTTSPGAAPTPARRPRRQAHAGLVVLTTVWVTTAASSILAILLFVAGILALRDRRAARLAHLWWAWIKLPFALAGVFGMAGLMRAFAEAGGSPGVPPDPAGVAFVTLFGGAIGLASVLYTAAVIVVLQGKKTKAWFASRP